MATDRVDLVIRKEGEQWCLFTADGSRKLGCHDTEADAKAQEAAVKAHEAMQRGISGSATILICLSDINASGDFQILNNGDVVKSIPLTDVGEDFINGGRKFSVTPELIDQAIKNFEASDKAPLPVTIGHTEDSAAPAAGWINDIFRGEDGRPWGKLLFFKDTWAGITAGKWKFFSAEFYPVDVNQKGEEIGFRFDGGAILNKPFFPIRVDQSRHGGAGASRSNASPTAAPAARRQTP